MMLDDVSPLERIKLSGQVAAQVAAAATATGMDRVRIAGSIAGLLAKLGEGAPQSFVAFEPQRDGSLIVKGDIEALTAAIKAIGGKPKAVAGGVRLTAGEARLREYIPVRIDRLASGAQLEYHESGSVSVRGDFRGSYMGAAAKLADLELYFTQDHGPVEFERVFGKPAPAEGAALHDEGVREVVERKADNQAREDAARLEYAKKTGDWHALTDEEKAALKAESDALTAEWEAKTQAEWETTIGQGQARGNERYQAYLDTLEDIPAIGRIMVQAGYMGWIMQRLAEYKATGVEPMPYTNGAARDAWQRQASAFVREWADQHLSRRVMAQRAGNSLDARLREDSGDAADEYAAKAVGFSSFHLYAESRKDKLPLQAFQVARARYKIVEHLDAKSRSNKLELEGLPLHGANSEGPAALSQLRNERVVVFNSRAQSNPFSLVAGMTLHDFVQGHGAVAVEHPPADDVGSIAGSFNQAAAGRAPAGGTIGMNGEFYKGGSFLPNTTLPKQGKAPGGTGAATGVLIEPGLRAGAPAPGYKSIFAGYREFLSIGADGKASVYERPDAAVAAYVNEDVVAGRAFLRAAADAYNAGMRWYKPGEIEVSDEHRAEPEAATFEIIEHITGKGKVLRGIVRTDLSHADAKAIDEYTFRKDGGYFIREKHLPAMGVPATPAPTADPVDPERQAELDAEREQLRLQADADRLADQQARERKKLDQQVAKLRSVAASTLEKAESALSADRQTNTARRADMAANTIGRAEAERAMGKTLGNLADAIERGQATHLAGVTSKVQVQTLQGVLRVAMYEAEKGLSYGEQLARKGRPPEMSDVRLTDLPRISMRYDYSSAVNALNDKKPKGYQSLLRELRTQDSSDINPELFARLQTALEAAGKLDALNWYSVEQASKRARLTRMGITSRDQLQAALGEYLEFREGARVEDPIAKAERAIIGQKVGIDFFPTPKALGQRMATLARIGEGDRVLEPSAGNGNLADAAKAAGAQVDVIEISSQLRDILEAKGHAVVAHDFMTYEPADKYDAIIANPPFSGRKDAEHIMRMFTMLKSGGSLVAIAGEGVFIGSDAKAVAFRDWLDNHGAEVEPLGQGTFKDANLLATTGANARLIVMRK